MNGLLKTSAAISLLALMSCAPHAKTSPEISQPTTPIEALPSGLQDLSAVIMRDTEGCLTGPMAQFGRYLGNWSMTSTTLSRDDGKTWIEGGKAQWNFKCVGKGIAIQDFWIPEAGGFGSNFRMYDAKSEKWDIAWVSNATPAMSHISAKQAENGNILMHYISPVLTPQRRITFFPPTAEGWNWALEISQDNGESWVTVVKMQARPA